MFKKLLLHVVLIFGLIGFLVSQSWAWGFSGRAGIGGGSYYLWFEIKGGGSTSAMEGTFVSGTLYVLEASLVCTNQGTNKKDVRGGQGGTTLVINTPLNDNTTTPIDDRGRFVLESNVIYADRDEVPDNVASTPDDKQVYFNNFWGVDGESCKNSGSWDPYAYLLQKVWITGTLWEDCNDSSPYPPPYDNTTCTNGGSVEFYCETLEDPRDWPGLDNKVDYICVPKGDPIAWDDPGYTVSMNRTLRVRAPGVLVNDSDGEGEDLTAIRTSNGSHGDVTLNSDGSFVYTPFADYVGPDSFTYKANDGSNDSERATVSITVY